jgi:Competence protein J (ComJ)
MTTESRFRLSVSYSQIAVFDGGLKNPFNSWTEAHVKQGFAWRPGSVSFATLEGGGCHHVEVLAERAEMSPQAIRAIQVPFEVPANGSIEIASIADSVPVRMPAGTYQLRFECFGLAPPKVRFVFLRSDSPSFEILRADAELSAIGDLVVTASPA